MALSPLQKGNFIHSDCHQSRADPDQILTRFSLEGKTAIVTGAAAGIGLAVAQALASMGANVIVWYNTNKMGPERAAAIAETYGVKCMRDGPFRLWIVLIS